MAKVGLLTIKNNLFMNIQIKDFVGLSEEDNLKLVSSLLKNRKPKEGCFNYGFETHGAIGVVFGTNKLPHAIQVYQSNKRKSDKSPIIIKIEKHTPI